MCPRMIDADIVRPTPWPDCPVKPVDEGVVRGGNCRALVCSPESGHWPELEFGSNIGAENAEKALFP